LNRHKKNTKTRQKQGEQKSGEKLETEFKKNQNLIKTNLKTKTIWIKYVNKTNFV